MRYALINHGAVVNVILASSEFIATLQGYQHALQLAEDSPVGVGWGWDGEVCTPPPEPAQPQPQDIIMQTIVAMEREQLMPRLTRETILSLAEERAAALGLTQAQLIAKNKGYAALKAFDTQIAALRAQLP